MPRVPYILSRFSIFHKIPSQPQILMSNILSFLRHSINPLFFSNSILMSHPNPMKLLSIRHPNTRLPTFQTVQYNSNSIKFPPIQKLKFKPSHRGVRSHQSLIKVLKRSRPLKSSQQTPSRLLRIISHSKCFHSFSIRQLVHLLDYEGFCC